MYMSSFFAYQSHYSLVKPIIQRELNKEKQGMNGQGLIFHIWVEPIRL
jgi:hypothetical protein